MNGPGEDQTAEHAEEKADDVGSNPSESGHSTADTQAERNAEDESPS